MSISLPSTSAFGFLEPATERAGSAVLAGFQTAAERGLLDSRLFFNITLRNTRCDSGWAPKSFIDSIVEGVHVMFGPSCEFALGRKVLKWRTYIFSWFDGTFEGVPRA